MPLHLWLGLVASLAIVTAIPGATVRHAPAHPLGIETMTRDLAR